MKEKLKNAAIGVLLFLRGLLNIVSQLLWYICTAGAAQGNESVSGACARKGYTYRERMINGICFWDKDHCAQAAWKDRDWAVSYADDPYFKTTKRL